MLQVHPPCLPCLPHTPCVTVSSLAHRTVRWHLLGVVFLEPNGDFGVTTPDSPITLFDSEPPAPRSLSDDEALAVDGSFVDRPGVGDVDVELTRVRHARDGAAEKVESLRQMLSTYDCRVRSMDRVDAIIG